MYKLTIKTQRKNTCITHGNCNHVFYDSKDWF